MHTIIAFITIVGGLIVFCLAGLILGPVVFTITRLLLEIRSSQNAVANGWLRQLVLAIMQAMCQYRKKQDIDGPHFLGANVMIAPDIAFDTKPSERFSSHTAGKLERAWIIKPK